MKKSDRVLVWLSKYLRYVNYIGAAQLYLKDNFFLRRPLEAHHIKDRILGHWGTVPGINTIYAHCNYLISKKGAELLFVAGSGHGAPGVLASIFAEGTFQEFNPECSRDGKGMGYLIKSFSWPNGFPSHTNPGTPGTILEGGELGYSLSTSFGAILDNPNLIAVCLVGDGEAESGPLAAAWHSNKFVNPAESGAVLPILHLNGYKISGPTIYGTMSDTELRKLFEGFGYDVRIIDGSENHGELIKAFDWAYRRITDTWKQARAQKRTIQPCWPMMIYRNSKGFSGIKTLDGKKIEGNFRSHGIPIAPCKDAAQLKILSVWLESYRINELVDSRGRPLPEVLEFVPQGNLRMGMNHHSNGGMLRKKLALPRIAPFEVTEKNRGQKLARDTELLGQYLRDVIVANPTNFRFMCPDETTSNKLDAMFEKTGRAYVWPLKKHDEYMDPRGRVMEILSEHTLQGWLQGYLITGRHGMFATYEAFAGIVATMVDQYAKFIKQARNIPWRKPISSLNYLLTSLGWRQEHNGFSHQNPGFVGNVITKYGEFTSVYFPPDANSLLVTMENCLKRKNAINIIVAEKNPIPQWLTLDEARKQLRTGIAVWDWAHPGSRDPDVVLAPIGDSMVIETMATVAMLRKDLPELNIRVVNISELTALGFGDEHSPLSHRQFEKYFTADRGIVFAFHGYADTIKKLLWSAECTHERASIHAYQEEGTTTTPFDMHVRNQTSRFHLAMDAVVKGGEHNAAVAKKRDKLVARYKRMLDQHQRYIIKYGKDMPEIEEWKW